CYSAIDRLRERNRPVIEPDVQVLTVDQGFANREHTLRIESDAAQRTIQRQHRSRDERNGLRLRRGGQRTQGDQTESKPARNRGDEAEGHDACSKDATGTGDLSSARPSSIVPQRTGN